MDGDLISIIVPVYNVELYLEECLQSLVAQTYQNTEIILVDDGSEDSCGRICDSYGEKYSNIKVIHKENEGLSAARNTGMEQAEGRWILFVDSDDHISREMCEKLYRTAAETGADIAIADRVKFRGSVSVRPQKPSVAVMEPKEALLRYFYREIPGYAWGKLYRRSALDGISFPVGKYYEDSFVMFRILDRVSKVAFLKEVLYYYRQRQGSIICSRYTGRQLDILEACEAPLAYFGDRDRELTDAVYSKMFVSAVDLLQKIPGGKEYEYDRGRAVECIRRSEKTALRDKKNGPLVKGMACIAAVSPTLLRWMGKVRKI